MNMNLGKFQEMLRETVRSGWAVVLGVAGIGYPLQDSWAFLVSQTARMPAIWETWVKSLGYEEP